MELRNLFIIRSLKRWGLSPDFLSIGYEVLRLPRSDRVWAGRWRRTFEQEATCHPDSLTQPT